MRAKLILGVALLVALALGVRPSNGDVLTFTENGGSTPVSANFPSQSYYVQNDHPDDMEILWYTNHSWTNPGYFEYYVNIWDDHTGGTISDTLHVEDYAGYMVICFCCGRFAAGFPAVGLV
jgi:hypothetical protein